MHLENYQSTYLPQIENGLRSFFTAFNFGTSEPLKDMLAYHLGWRDDGVHGKRLRPLITLLCTSALGGSVISALPAALAIEFLHNFTLIHDDIEDRSPLRHGRETLWMRWGEAQAINAGDALFSIAQMAILDLEEATSQRVTIQTTRRFNQTCLQLTRGQYLDIAFENEDNISLETYIDMIHGKTAALIAFSAAASGLVTESKQTVIDHLETFGKSLGLAFQIQDDSLGIWGDPKVTGKSIASDLLAKKKTLPVLFGLQNCDEFRKLWGEGEMKPKRVERMSSLLKSCGAQEYVREKAEQNINDAFSALQLLFPSEKPENRPAKALFELSEQLLGRDY